jgi:hypothetical protein
MLKVGTRVLVATFGNSRDLPSWDMEALFIKSIRSVWFSDVLYVSMLAS